MSTVSSAIAPRTFAESRNAQNPVPIQNREQQQSSCGSKLLNGVYSVAMQTGAGYLAGLVFSVIDPVGGAVFGATSAASSFAIGFLAERSGMNTTCAKIIICIASFAVGIGVASFVTTTVGFPITFFGGLVLTLAMLLTNLAIRVVIEGALCCSACLGGAALASRA